MRRPRIPKLDTTGEEMANRFRGEIETASGYTLVMDYNALANLEDLTGRPAFDVLSDFEQGRGRINDIRAFVFSCARNAHPDISLNEAGDILSEDSDCWARVILAATPATPEAESGNSKPRAKRGG